MTLLDESRTTIFNIKEEMKWGRENQKQISEMEHYVDIYNDPV